MDIFEYNKYDENAISLTLQEELKMTYAEYVEYLANKYGKAIVNYYCTPECKSKNPKVTRTKEGLECHHIDEDKYILLSKPYFARKHWETQLADRLIYADKIEHLLLHIKITVENCSRYNPDADDTQERDGFGFGCGCKYIIGSINSLFETPPTSGWQLNMYNKIKDRFDDYCELLVYLGIVYQVPTNILFCVDTNALEPTPTKVMDRCAEFVKALEPLLNENPEEDKES